MKTTMKLFAALTIMLGFSVTTFGQAGSSSAPILGHATVVAQVLVTGVKALEFGNVTPGIAKTIDVDGTAVTGNSSGGTLLQAGKFTVEKALSTPVTLSWTLPTALLSGTTPMTINFNDFTGGTGKCGQLLVGTVPTSFTVQVGTVAQPLVISSTSNNGAFLAGSFDINLGGTVLPASAQATGTYEGSITLLATYN